LGLFSFVASAEERVLVVEVDFFFFVCVWETSAEDQADFTGRKKEKEGEREHTGLGVDTRVYALTSIFPICVEMCTCMHNICVQFSAFVFVYT
jgi:hypothetical protein